ncbi:MAG: hypothetical protein IPI65_08200 [Bacteroidetes bacterium]|nr:hypothetical protein [Bacteroidota bacterium]
MKVISVRTLFWTKICRAILPIVRHHLTLIKCDVYKSTNGGATWDAGTYAYGGDKQWMAIDRTNGVGSGNIYTNWTVDYTAYTTGILRSTDGTRVVNRVNILKLNLIAGMPAVDAVTGYLYVVGGGFQQR